MVAHVERIHKVILGIRADFRRNDHRLPQGLAAQMETRREKTAQNQHRHPLPQMGHRAFSLSRYNP